MYKEKERFYTDKRELDEVDEERASKFDRLPICGGR